ncbi:MAG: hypothetical protein L0G99_12670, partial [Propionibacteriales bacterium]|nr:hypothetical protein [Propionibacteriales bacterium]
ELVELFGKDLYDYDVYSVCGLMAKELNRVPIAGSVVRFEGLELVAERVVGRRNRISTVLVSSLEDDHDDEDRGIAAATRLAAQSSVGPQLSGGQESGSAPTSSSADRD